MILLGMDTSAVAASVALWEDGRIIGESFVNVRLTHSQTILPMTQNLLNACGKIFPKWMNLRFPSVPDRLPGCG